MISINEINKSKEKFNLPIMIMYIIGVVLIVFGVLIVVNRGMGLNLFPTTGTINSTQRFVDNNGNEEKSATVQYRIDNTNYTATITNATKNYKLSENIVLYYDLVDPSHISVKPTGYIGYICSILGIILIIKTGPKFIRIIRDNYLLIEQEEG